MASMMPLIIIGGLSLMFNTLPIPWYQDFITTFANGRIHTFFETLYSCCFNMFSIFVVISLSYNYSRELLTSEKETLIVSLISLSGFFILCADIITPNYANTNAYAAGYLFTAMLCSYITCRMYKFISQRTGNKTQYYTLNSDSGFITAFSAVFPALIILATFCIINILISEVFKTQGIQGLFTLLCSSLFSNVGRGYFAMLLYTILVQIMWFFGIHGNNVLKLVMTENFVEIDGSIFSKCFYDVFINIGGSGTILCIALAVLIVSKTKELRYIAKAGFLPSVFNISEIISFGLPILFNPFLLIPFILVPIVSGTIAYLATSLGLVPIITNTVEWTTPGIYSGYLATGSYAGSILQIVIIVVGILIYIPFVKLYEEQLHSNAKTRLKELVDYMIECENSQKEPNLLSLNNSVGQTAKVLAQELPAALKNGEIYFNFQPQMDNNNHCIGGESLIRWNHKDAGFIYPPLIIRLAMESNMLEDIDRALVKSTCEVIRTIEGKYNRNIKMSVNMTVASFAREGFEEMFSTYLYKYGISASSLHIELTENEMLTSDEDIQKKIRHLQSLGHKLIIDDFGMGHTSLTYLQKNRFDVVKLDGILTRNLEAGSVNSRIIRSICELGESLNYSVVAEYVETQKQRDLLESLGCSYYQGYLYSPAISAEDFEKFYREHLA